ncbi:hypothetical protein EMPG_11420 [Blastomyces silverae]|uniref:Uncharacterized protein n=1 Tax=Blastomyces silverae TaxID=2060906 RepID=A0A0H1BRN6_9EURO|nr:hypothetical protein EMPG_11420 [Blastomyces silverae]
MSFGFSVGDFIAVGQLINKLRKEFVGAPGQFRAISDELRSLSIVIQDVDLDLSERDLSDQQKVEVGHILHGCHNVLEELQKTLEEYGSLESSSGGLGDRMKRMWKKLKWEDVSEFRGRIASNIALLNTFVGRISSAATFATKKGVDRLNQFQDDQEQLAILNWLTHIDYTSQHNDFLSRRQAGTGQWLLDSPQYETWLTTIGETLFCPGIPGTGKTIMTSIVIDNLTTRFLDDSGVAIAYIYCNFRKHEEQKVDNLAASLLRQLAGNLFPLPKSVKELYELHNRKRTRPSFDGILATLHSVAGEYSRVFIVTDALDECQASDGCRERLISGLFHIQDKCGVNIFATSRPLPDIVQNFEKGIALEIRASDEDVQNYLDGHMYQLPASVRCKPDLQKEIKTHIVNAVRGMYVDSPPNLINKADIIRFLLAQLHFDSLKGKRSPKAIRAVLSNLATGSNTYDQAYDGAMDRIEGQLKDESDLAKQALAWITCAKRPLTSAELQHACAVEVGEAELDAENLSEIEDIVSVCAGLVTVDEESDVVRLVHYTTQQYFERTQSRWFPNAEADITAVCATYLSFRVFESGVCYSRYDFEDRRRLNPLYDYAARNWGHHASKTSGSCQAITSFLEDKPKVEASSQVLITHARPFKPFSSQMTGLHMAAYFGVESSVRLLLSEKKMDARDHYGRTPLHWAAQNGCESVVKLLLERGADFESKDTSGQTPLNRASVKGRESIVKLLLEKGADFESKDTSGRTPLNWAAENGCESVVKLLLEKGADLKSKDNGDKTPLIRASSRGHEAVVKLLLEKGADFESKDTSGQTPLNRASVKGRESIVKLLLEKGADFESKDKDGWTPLSWAAAYGGEAVLLLEKGADFESKDKDGWTPLSWAAAYEDEAVVKLLLEKGADFESKDDDGRRPLTWACTRGNTAIAKLLLEKGADFEFIDQFDQTPLSWAAENGSEAVMKLLLEKGANLESNDEEGSTSLF